MGTTLAETAQRSLVTGQNACLPLKRGKKLKILARFARFARFARLAQTRPAAPQARIPEALPFKFLDVPFSSPAHFFTRLPPTPATNLVS